MLLGWLLGTTALNGPVRLNLPRDVQGRGRRGAAFCPRVWADYGLASQCKPRRVVESGLRWGVETGGR